MGKRACAIGVSVVNYFETETNSGRDTPFERIAAKRLALQNGHVDDFDKPADATSPELPTNHNRYDAFPAEFYDRVCGKMSPIYAYGYEISLHKLLLPSCGILG